jgi:tetratricopeptide (TPR) repeat protein
LEYNFEITDIMVNELETRIKQLEQKLDILSDQLNKALVYIEDDPHSSLTKSRTILEQILLNIYKLEMDQEPKRIELGAILTDNQFTRKIDKRIVSRMNAIRDMCNLGVHGEKVVSKDAKIVLDNLCEVLEWYFENYKPIKSEKEPLDSPARSKRKPRKKLIFMLLGISLVILVIFPLILLKFGWNDLIRTADPGKAKKEQAIIYAINARKLCDNGELEGAKREAALSLNADPGNSSAWTTLSAISFKEGDKNKAIEQTLEALKADPTNSTAAYNLAYSFDDIRDYQQAIEWYSKAIKIDSAKVPAYSALGRLYNQIQQTADAVLILSLAERKYPDSEYIYLIHKNLGNSYLLLNQINSAIKYLELSIAVKPDEPETNLFLAKSYEASGNLTKSLDYWQKYISFESDSAKIEEARRHLKELSVKHLQDILK